MEIDDELHRPAGKDAFLAKRASLKKPEVMDKIADGRRRAIRVERHVASLLFSPRQA
jgi:hypothetical protein